MKAPSSHDLLNDVTSCTERLLTEIGKLEACAEDGASEAIIACMNDLRETVDQLEGLLPDEIWPLPSYAEMMFMM